MNARLQRIFSKPKEYRRESNEDARNKKQGRNLPHFVIYVSWFRKLFSNFFC
jgi:hypothetical protein